MREITSNEMISGQQHRFNISARPVWGGGEGGFRERKEQWLSDKEKKKKKKEEVEAVELCANEWERQITPATHLISECVQSHRAADSSKQAQTEWHLPTSASSAEKDHCWRRWRAHLLTGTTIIISSSSSRSSCCSGCNSRCRRQHCWDFKKTTRRSATRGQLCIIKPHNVTKATSSSSLTID